MNIIVILLVAYIVPVVLSYFTIQASKSTTDSIEYFDLRPIANIAKLGWLAAGFFLFCIYGSYIAGQFDGLLAVIFGGLFVLGVLLILAPTKGFWDATVKGDEIVARRIWIFRKSLNIKDIDYCLMNKGGCHIYKKGRKIRYMSIDGMSQNLDNWLQRMKIEGIEVKESF